MKVLIAGAGVAGIEAMLALHDLASERVEVELLSPQVDFTYRPLAVAEPFGTGQAYYFDLTSFAAENDSVLHLGELVSVDAERRSAKTSGGVDIEYDALLVASGAKTLDALPGALSFTGHADADEFRQLLEGARNGDIDSIAFALPGGVSWPLPLYELAIQTATHLAEQGAKTKIMLVTPEDQPLGLFGATASEAVLVHLEERGIALYTDHYPRAFRDGELEVIPSGSVQADRVVSLPTLRGPFLPGLPHDTEGFIPIDQHCRVEEHHEVFAAGDVTAFPVKQGGIAAQQGDAAAEAIAADAGADLRPAPFDPVLRGLLLTGGEPSYLRADIGGGHGDTSTVATEPLWWPPSKIVGRYLAPFLAEHTGWTIPPKPTSGANVLPIEIDVSEFEQRRLR